jgi:hypothetical protein
MIQGEVVVDKSRSRTPQKIDIKISAFMNSPMVATNNLSNHVSIE